ncbi:DUF2961 domain-containing protein [Candidatus Saccharibacteria bacterium]|nr:DUF2961 domain-containing protein [Candidatus Saccharibacteria bacterium]
MPYRNQKFKSIPKSDLAPAIQASLDKADTALQVVPPSAATVSSSGFPLRLNGERSISHPVELGKAHTSSANPAGPKRVLLAESWGAPGILRHIWVASSGGGSQSDFAEDGGLIRVFIDNETTAAVELSLNDFFAYAPLGGEFSNQRIGRTKRDTASGESAAYRYLHMPFQKYLRVEIENTTSTDTIVFGSADYSLISEFSAVGSQQVAYKIIGTEKANAAPYEAITLVDTVGGGQLESLWIAIDAANGDTGILEGNIEIYVDGEIYPSWQSSGTEDAFNGGWYNVPVGGFPAGRSGFSSGGDMKVTLYRFFIDDPLFFSTHIKVVVHAGQRSQGTISSSSFGVTGLAGIWFNTAGGINFKAPNVDVPLLNDQFTGPLGNLDSGIWNQVGGVTQGQATGSSITVAYDGTATGQDVRIARKGVSLVANYWLETRARVIDATHNGQEVSLIAKGNEPDPYFGSAVHVQLVRFSQYNWVVRVRDDFDEVFVRTIGNGSDLTNVWVKLALKIVGTTATAYWSHGESTLWHGRIKLFHEVIKLYACVTSVIRIPDNKPLHRSDVEL